MAKSFDEKRVIAGVLFTPSAPIHKKTMLSGRAKQLEQLIDLAFETGRHAILYGDRGVGKTSLANVVLEVFQATSGNSAAKATCAGTEQYTDVVQAFLASIHVTFEGAPPIGFQRTPVNTSVSLLQVVGANPTNKQVADVLRASGRRITIIIDEFDRLPKKARQKFADLIKVISDEAIAATLILVGVADSVDELIDAHGSTERALAQIPLPRLSPDAARELILTRLEQLEEEIDDDALESIVKLAQGLPHVVHSLGLNAVRAAVGRKSNRIEVEDVVAGMQKLAEDLGKSHQTAYRAAVYSPHESLYDKVLLSCALAKKDEEGFFSARNVLPFMQRFHNATADHGTFNTHLSKFCSSDRSSILKVVGAERLKRYRFSSPTMQIYVLIRALEDGAINLQDLPGLSADSEDA